MSDKEREFQRIIENVFPGSVLSHAGERDGRKSVVIAWGIPGIGFGELTLVEHEGKLYLDTEHSSRQTVMKILNQLVDGAVLDTDEDPEAHIAYSKAMQRTCGEHCKLGCDYCPRGDVT